MDDRDEQSHASSPVSVMTPAERERADRVAALAARGEQGVAELVEMLVDPSWAVRRRVVQALASLGDAAIAPLADVLRNRRDDETRLAAAVDALAASLGDAEAEIVSLTQHESAPVVADGAQILGRRRLRSAVPRLVELTSHPDDNVAVAALEALGRVGGRAAVDRLIGAVRSGNFFRAFPAIDVLGRSGDPRAVKPLAELLDDPQYALEAVRALGRTGDLAAVPALTRLLSHPADTTVRIACSALAVLDETHRARVGDTGAVEAEIRRSAPPTAVRNVIRALVPASFAEQQEICWVLGALASEDAVPALADLLDAPPSVARAAATALERIGRNAAEQVMAALREGHSEQRRALLPVIVSRLHAMDGVIACLSDPDPGVRAAACEALIRIANPAAVRPLFERLGDPDPRVVQSAVSAIQSLGSAETESLALDAARSPSVSARRAAFRILAYFGYSSALGLFLAAIDGDDPRLRDAALQGLAFIETPRALEALFEAARHPEARTRASAMRALGHARNDLRATSALLRGLSDEDAWVRYYACQSLGRVGFEAAVDSIAALLEDSAGQVRVAAVEALSHLKSDTARAALVETSRSDDPDVRRAALLGLGIARRTETLPILIEASRAEDAATRLVAISALAGFAEPEVSETLLRAAEDLDESVRTASIGFLASRHTGEATRCLIRLASSPDPDEQVRSALAVYSHARVEAIVEALESADDELSPILTSALARMRRSEAEEALVGALSTASPAGRKAVAQTLAAIGNPKVMSALRHCADCDPDLEVRQVCASALAR